MLVGLAGAIYGAMAVGLLGALWGELLSVDNIDWIEWALLGATLLGYPLGAVYGVLVVGKERGQTGSIGLALLGALVGTGLGAGIYYAQLAGRQHFDVPQWAETAVMMLPIALIPSLAALGYGFRPTKKWAERLRQLTPDSDIVRPGGTATTQVGAARDQQPSQAGEGTQPAACPNCDAPNPADSAFCGECGAPVVALEA
jgi:hypothetical protein